MPAPFNRNNVTLMSSSADKAEVARGLKSESTQYANMATSVLELALPHMSQTSRTGLRS